MNKFKFTKATSDKIYEFIDNEIALGNKSFYILPSRLNPFNQNALSKVIASYNFIGIYFSIREAKKNSLLEEWTFQ